MALDDNSPAAGGGSRYGGDGFRLQPEYREAAMPMVGGVPVSAVPEADPTVAVAKRAVAPNLDLVFDDPAVGEPGRDRMLVHGLWELVLVIAIAGVGYLLYRKSPEEFTDSTGLRSLAFLSAIIGALAAGLAISLRAGVPNLAVGATAVAAGYYFALHSSGGMLASMLVVVGLCAAVGLVQALVTVGLHVPGWAASLGAAVALAAWADHKTTVQVAAFVEQSMDHVYWWFGGVALVSVVGGLMGLVPSLRRGLGRFRPVADPAQRRGGISAVVAGAAIVASAVMAGVGGVLLVSFSGGSEPSTGALFTEMAVGAALLGGVSAFGRRGGVFGTMLATVLIFVAIRYSEVTGHRSWGWAPFAGAAIGIGLIVTRLVERYGRPKPGDVEIDDHDEDWMPRQHSTPSGSWPLVTSAPAPAQPAAGGLWASDDAWGTTERR